MLCAVKGWRHVNLCVIEGFPSGVRIIAATLAGEFCWLQCSTLYTCYELLYVSLRVDHTIGQDLEHFIRCLARVAGFQIGECVGSIGRAANSSTRTNRKAARQRHLFTNKNFRLVIGGFNRRNPSGESIANDNNIKSLVE